MNRINKLFLRLVLAPKNMYIKMGVDVFQLQNILSTKLLIDDRTPSALMKMQRKKKKQPKNISITTLLVSMLFGIFYLFPFLMPGVPVTQYTVYFTLLIFMLSFSIITDFTSVLLDTRDHMIILPRPINARTVTLSKILHIAVHLLKVAVPMILPALIYTMVSKSIFSALLLVCSSSLLLIFTVFFVNAFYLLMLRYMHPKKFQSFISVFQIIFGLAIYLTFVLLPKMEHIQMGIKDLDVSKLKWTMLYPPYWFAAMTNPTSVRTWSGFLSVFLGIGVPIIGFVMMIKYLAPAFASKMAQLSASAESETDTAAKSNADQPNHKSYADKMAQFFCKNEQQKATFLLTWQLTGRLKDFKLKVYPFLAYVILYLFILSTQGENPITLAQIRHQEQSGKVLFIGIIYSSALFVWTALYQIAFADKYKSAWIYFISPVTTAGTLVSGGVKAVLVKYFAPIFLLVVVAGLALVGVKILPNLILGTSNCLILVLLMYLVDKKRLPFSAWQGNEGKVGTFVKTLLKMLLIGIFAFVQYLIYDMTVLVSICAVLSLIACWLIYTSIRNLPWNKISIDMDAA